MHKSLLGACPVSELAQVAQAKSYQVYRKGQLIYHRGSRPGGIHCIHGGKVKLSRVTADGKEQIVRLAKEGDVLGYPPIIANNTYTTTAVALTDCVVCHVPRCDFLSLIEQNTQLAHSVMRLLANALHHSEQRLLHLAYKPVRQRLAEALLLLHELFRPADEAASFSIPVSRDDLAALIGTAKETASRLLSDFRDENLLRTQGSRITVLDVEQVARISMQYE